jgi:hypothetical protein
MTCSVKLTTLNVSISLVVIPSSSLTQFMTIPVQFHNSSNYPKNEKRVSWYHVYPLCGGNFWAFQAYRESLQY